MAEYNTVDAKLSDPQLNNFKAFVKNQTGVTLTNIKMFNGNNLLYKLSLTTRQKTKLKMGLKIICQLIKSYLKLRYLK